MVRRGGDERLKELNSIDARNFKLCAQLTTKHTLEEYLGNHPLLLSIFKNYRAAKFDELTLFYVFMMSLPHWALESKLYNRDTHEYTTVKFLAIIRGESVCNKSGYMKRIREACLFIERYFREMFIDDTDGKFKTTMIESLSTAKLISDLETSSKFISSDEETPLNNIDFFDPQSKEAQHNQTIVISGFNGIYLLLRGTMMYAKVIRDRSLSMLAPTTGLYERLMYWCISKDNFVTETVALNNSLASMEYLYIIRILIGFRLYQLNDDAYHYLKPITDGLRMNETPIEIKSKPSFYNRRDLAVERRSADLIERLAMMFQTLFDIETILKDIKDIQFSTIKRVVYEQFKEKICTTFYKNDDAGTVNDSIIDYSSGDDIKEYDEVRITSIPEAPKKSLKISLEAAQTAVRFYDDILFPTSLQLFNCQPDSQQNMLKNNENERKILDLPFNMFTT
ncbi:unnamed protein product, partial [Didymodactylos carnosus]